MNISFRNISRPIPLSHKQLESGGSESFSKTTEAQKKSDDTSSQLTGHEQKNSGKHQFENIKNSKDHIFQAKNKPALNGRQGGNPITPGSLGEVNTRGVPEALNKAFEADPEGFANTHIINVMNTEPPGGEYDTINRNNPLEGRISSFRMTPTRNGNTVRLEAVPVDRTKPSDIQAVNLPFMGNSKSPGYVDIQKDDPAADFVFTGQLTGCSIIVTEHPSDPSLLRVYHDPRPPAPDATDQSRSTDGHPRPYADTHIYARVDYPDYERRPAEGGTPASTAFMRHDCALSRWVLHYQVVEMRPDPTNDRQIVFTRNDNSLQTAPWTEAPRIQTSSNTTQIEPPDDSLPPS